MKTKLVRNAMGLIGITAALSFGMLGEASAAILNLTGASVYAIKSGAYTGNGWDTTANNGAYNLYLLTESGAFLNSGNGAAVSLNLDISNPGTYTFLYRSDGGGFNWPGPSAGLNLFFNNATNPGISASVPFNASLPTLTAFSNGSLGIVNADVVPGANSLSFMIGDSQVVLTAFSLIDYRNPSVQVTAPNLVSPVNNVPNGINDYSGVIKLQVTAPGADSHTAAPPPALESPLPEGDVWTKPDVPLRGIASPGATVTLHVTGLHNGETRTFTTVAGADGTWSIVLPDLEDCHYELQVEVNGVPGNKLVVNVDSHAPTTTLFITSSGGAGGGTDGAGGTGGSGGWHTGPVTVNLAASDGAAGQGVAGIEYSLDGSSYSAFPSDGLTFADDGVYNLCYRSIDNIGHVELTQCVPVWVDATPPTITPSFDPVSKLLSFDTADGGSGGSGIAGIEVSLDGGRTWTSQTGPLAFPRDGMHIVYYRCIDNAGNITEGQVPVTVVTPPTIVAPPDQTAIEGSLHGFQLGAFSDAGADSPWTVDIDWGDGSAHSGFTLMAPGSLGTQPHVYADNGRYTATVQVTDRAGNADRKRFNVTVSNVAPTATLSSGGPVIEGGTAMITLVNPSDVSSVDRQAGLRYAFACDGTALVNATYANGSPSAGTTCAYADGPASVTVRARIIDKDDGFTEYLGTVTVHNVAPAVGVITAPADPVNIDTAVDVHADFSDPGVLDTHTAVIDWGDGSTSAGSVTQNNGSGTASGTHSYAVPGLYTVTVTVTDKDGAAGSASHQSIVVIDPDGPFVTGNVRFDSTAGAMPGDPAATGEANLKIKVQYKKGGGVPTGAASFDFDGGKLHFQSSGYDWLAAWDDRAIVRGSGTLNGAGDYGLLLSMAEGEKGKGRTDLVRVRIWDKATNEVVYDSQPGAGDAAAPVTPVTKGNVTVH